MRLAPQAAALVALLATACAPAAVGVGPGVAPAERDLEQRATIRPPVDPYAVYVSTTVETDLPVALTDFVRWFGDRAAPDLGAILVGSKTVPRVVRTEPLTTAWGRPGSRRRVVLADGNTALEELLVDHRPDLFQYEVWNFTSDGGKYVRYAVGEFHFSGDAAHTHVRWSYHFRPRGWPDCWLVGPFVHGDYHDFMTSGLVAIRARALRDLAE